jgi:hypothetical protein
MIVQNLLELYPTEFNPYQFYGLVIVTHRHRNGETNKCFIKHFFETYLNNYTNPT